MKILVRLVGFSVLAVLGACATAPKPVDVPPDPDYADGRQRSYIAVREFVLYSAPRPESPQVGRVMKGEHIEAAFSLYEAPWNRMTLDDGRRVFVFGNPIYPANPK